VAGVGAVIEDIEKWTTRMPSSRLKYHQPSAIEETRQIMGESRAKARPLAGGRDQLIKR
jgi:hypothetical protein